MPRRLSFCVMLALLALAAVPAVASAGWFPAQPVDGPTPDIDKLGGVDLARDGTGGLVYLKRIDGTPHVFLSRFNGGQFRPPERVDNGIGAGASEAAIAAADADRLAIVWIAGSRVYGAVVTGNDAKPGPLLGPTELYNDPSGPVSDVAIDMGINGAAYASWAGPGGGGADVRVSRLMDVTWTLVGAPLDIDAARAAGRGTQRSRVAVSAEGNAVVVWGENHADGRPRVYMRRVTGTAPSAFPQELSLNDLGGQIGGRADQPDIDVEDDGSFAWAVFRQDFAGGSRSVARRLLGSTFDPGVPLDGGPTTGSPRIGMNGRGQGLAAIETLGGGATGLFLYNDVFEPGVQLSSQPSAAGTEPKPASSEHREVALAWRVADGAGNGSIRGRFKPEPTVPFENEVELSRPDLGPVAPGQFAIGADRVAGFAVAMVQGAPGSNRTVTAAVQDRPPGRPGAIAHRGDWQNKARPKLEWRPGIDLWGPQTFRVLVGGKVVGETTGSSLVPKQRLRAGRPLPYQVIAIDVRGQQSPSRTRVVRFDNQGPRLTVKVVGKRSSGRALRIVVRAKDGKGSGVKKIRVRYGDSKRIVEQRGKRFRGAHAYRHGSFKLRVTGYDFAGNRRVKIVRLRIS
ncbi:MAG: hypothetical protein QOC68_4249 [Solirubrobacteraceae bacterium]|nr:hypothetical protein [Solirubrobacteraceae bacterium]